MQKRPLTRYAELSQRASLGLCGFENKKSMNIICARLNRQTRYVSVKTDGVERTPELYEKLCATEGDVLIVTGDFGYIFLDSIDRPMRTEGYS